MELAGEIVGERQVRDIDEAVRIALRCPAVVAFTLKNNHATFYHSGVELKKKKKASAWRKPSTNVSIKTFLLINKINSHHHSIKIVYLQRYSHANNMETASV